MKINKLKYITCAFLALFMVGLITTFADMTVVSADTPSTGIEEKKDYDETLEYIKCGDNYIPAPVAPVTRVATLMLQIVLPLAIILVGSMDFVKAVVASDQEKIKKNQHQFFNRLKAGLIFFLVITVFRFMVSLIADNSGDFLDCIDCLISSEETCGNITTDNPYLSGTYE